MDGQTQIEAFAPDPAAAPVPSSAERVPLPESSEPAPRVPLGELEDGQRVRGVFAVRARELRRKRNGEPWLRLEVGDASGSAEAVCWEEAEERYAICGSGSAVHLSGVFEVNERWGAKIKISGLRAAEPHEYSTEDLAAASDVDAEQLETRMRELLDEAIEDTQLRQLLDYFFGELSPTWHRFRDAPAAKVYHQAYRHGLLEHSLSVAQAVNAAAGFFPGIDREVAVAGALLHDIGKTVAYNDDPLAIDLTDAGRLEGEIPLGYYLVRRQIEEISGFDTGLARCILHVILSHHGSLEHGSPVVPSTREAVLVHMIDNLGGRLGSFDRLERQLPAGESWSGFDRALSGAAFFSQRAA
ncbi:MAG TPA: HD domain-containing protein [Solirubrobacterales bacterium]|jgi:3'-5' exoribonuclease|nr:HD domain-containing protein [Solirubrobacterales bacterium]